MVRICPDLLQQAPSARIINLHFLFPFFTTSFTSSLLGTTDIFSSAYVHDLINEPHPPWLLRAAIYHMGLDVKNESHPVRSVMHIYIYIYIACMALFTLEATMMDRRPVINSLGSPFAIHHLTTLYFYSLSITQPTLYVIGGCPGIACQLT